MYRVAKRFGLIGAAGELATAAGLTGWPEGAAQAAAARCFADWLQTRGGVGNADESPALSQVRLFFEQYGEARFKPWTPCPQPAMTVDPDGDALCEYHLDFLWFCECGRFNVAGNGMLCQGCQGEEGRADESH